MTSFISHTSVDCRDAYALSEWWKQVLEYVDDPGDANEVGDDECWIQRPDGGHPLLFIGVPEDKQVKNRIHLDLTTRSVDDFDDSIEGLISLGASHIDIGQGAVVCAGAVLAVEAQEGTDAMLRRCAELPAALRGSVEVRRGVLAKAPKPIQERRVDLPTIGPETVAAAAAAGLAGVVVEGVEHGSVVLRDDDGGQWQVGRGQASLVGRRVRLRGRVRTDVMTTAQQGVPFEVLEVLASDDGPSEPPPGPRGSDPRL